MEAVDSCDLCGSKRQKAFEVYERYGQTFTFVECSDCGLAYLTPHPTVEEMPRYYDEAYGMRHGVYRESASRRQLVVRHVRRLLLKTRYAGIPIVSAVARGLFSRWETGWQQVLRGNHMEGISPNSRVLDVGCACGVWLARIRRWGFDCYGCEPDPRAAAIAQSMAGLSVVCSDLPGAKYPNDHFAVVRFKSVLEHIHDPTEVLLETKRVLRLGGLVIIDVPNHVGISAQAFRHSEDVPRHLYSYSPETIRRYFEKVGLRVVRITTETKPYSIYGYFKDRAIEMLKATNASPEEITQAEQFWFHKNQSRQSEYRATAQFFDSIGRGCHVIAVGTKDNT